jgi:hypothetical protein
MPLNENAKRAFKGILCALAGIAVATLGIFVVGAFKDHFTAYPFRVVFSLTESVGIDVLGAVVPFAVAAVCAVVFFKYADNPAKKLALAFGLAVGLAFLLGHPTSEGLAGYPLLFALLMAPMTAGINVYPNPFPNLRRNLVVSLLLTLVCVPLALFVVDLAYVPLFAGSTIGGNGLTDGILISTLYAPLCVVGAFSVLSYVSQMIGLVQASRRGLS